MINIHRKLDFHGSVALSYPTCSSLPQLEQRAEQHSLTQLALEEKRSELVSVETQLRELEEKYYRGSIQVHEEMVEDLRVG